jgi:hypothetical protein
MDSASVILRVAPSPGEVVGRERPMNDYDTGSRYAILHLDPEGFLVWLVPTTRGSRAWKGWLPTERITFPGEPERRCDTVARFESVTGTAPPVALIVESQTRPRGDLPEREGEYALRIRREIVFHRDPLVQYDVVAALLNLTGPPNPEEWVMEPAGFGGLGMRLRLKVAAMRDVEARQILTGVREGNISVALLAWLPLMKDADNKEMAREWADQARAVNDERITADLGALARLFAKLAERKEVWDPVLEGWNVERSPVVLEWQKQAQHANVVAARRVLMSSLQSRLSGELPPDLLTAIQAQEQHQTLLDWLGLLSSGVDLEEVCRRIRS